MDHQPPAMPHRFLSGRFGRPAVRSAVRPALPAARFGGSAVRSARLVVRTDARSGRSAVRSFARSARTEAHTACTARTARTVARTDERHRLSGEPSAAALLLRSALLLFLLPGCAAQPVGRGTPQPVGQGTPVGRSGGDLLPVLATAAPVNLLAQALGAGCARVEPLVSGARDSHDLHATPADLVRLGRARVLVINGLGLEHELPTLLRSVANSTLRVVDSSRGVTPVLVQGRPDPHIWLDPRRALVQVETIRDGLVAADPGCRDRYTANARALRVSLLALDRELATQLVPFRGGVVVGPHAFMASFADRYGLRAEGLVATPEASPSPGDLRRVLVLLAPSGPRALVQEPGESAGSIVALGRDLGLEPVPFDPMEAGFTDAPPATAADPLGPYTTVQRGNGRQLVAAFRASLARGQAP
jgi:zinc/manganese transport system substrate-binding protein